MYFLVDLSPLVQEEFQVLFLHLSFYNRANKRDSFLINGIEQIYEQTVHGLGIEFIPQATVTHDPVSKDEIELTDKESKQYQEILNTAVQLEEIHNKVIAEIQQEYKKFLKSNDQHYKKYKELEAEIKKGKITTDNFNSIDNLSYNTIQTKLIQY